MLGDLSSVSKYSSVHWITLLPQVLSSTGVFQAVHQAKPGYFGLTYLYLGCDYHL